MKLNIIIILKVEKSRSPHGERGLKFRTILYKIAKVICRSPHGERGLKSSSCSIYLNGISSLSSRRAWIEIKTDEIVNLVYSTGRSPHGERGLKYIQ